MKWYSPVSYTGMFLSLVVGILKSYRSYRLFSLLLGLLLPSWSWLQYHCMKQGETWLILQLNSNSLKLTKPRYKLNHFKDPCHWWPCLIFICYYWPKVSRRKEIIEIRAEINEKEVKETIERLIKLKPGSLINKIDKPLARLQGKKGEESNQQN